MCRNFNISVSILFLLLASCGGGSTDKEYYYFEVVYQNYAWGAQHHGLFINSNGEVYTYDVSDTTDEKYIYLETDSSYDESLLAKKFDTNRIYKENIDLPTLQDMSSLTASAETGTLSDPTHIAYDAGLTRYKAFIYNPEENTYKSVLLYQTGDFEITNSALEATEIKDWLEGIAAKCNIPSFP